MFQMLSENLEHIFFDNYWIFSFYIESEEP